MELFLLSTNPENTMLLSANGVAHYQVQTTKSKEGLRVTSIFRPAVFPQDGVLAEIVWKNRDSPTVIRSPLLLCDVRKYVGNQDIGMKASRYLYKRNRFSSARYFIGDDQCEYRWKIVKHSGCILTRSDTGAEIASSTYNLVTEGLFAGEKKQNLRIQPCSVDIDLIVLTFVIMERNRRERDGYGLQESIHDEDPQGDGAGSGGGEAEEGVIGEL